ncbi:hypothetical protein SAMN05444172_8388 [Burkholderia sp. GAS332]|nr:hypothetical protein SAMN05444172_8388 [Burkholderia sp. GAS332]
MSTPCQLTGVTDSGNSWRVGQGVGQRRLRRLQHALGRHRGGYSSEHFAALFPHSRELLRPTVQQVIGTYLERFRPVTDNTHLPPEASFDALMDSSLPNSANPRRRPSGRKCGRWVGMRLLRAMRVRRVSAIQTALRRSHRRDQPGPISHECAVRGAMINFQMEGIISLVRRFSKNAPDQEALLVAAKAVCKALTQNPE